MLQVTGYVDRWSVPPGETINFMISSLGGAPFQAHLTRVFCGDPNPEGPGLREIAVPSPLDGTHPGHEQRVRLGSCAVIPHVDLASPAVSIALTIYPTRLSAPGRQCVLHWGDGQTTIRLDIQNGRLAATCGQVTVALPGKLTERHWTDIGLTIDLSAGTMCLGAKPRQAAYAPPPHLVTETIALPAGFRPAVGTLHLAADDDGRDVYNGRLERPVIYAEAMPPQDLLAALALPFKPGPRAAWDFSIGIETSRITDVGPNAWHGTLRNLPTRGVTGAAWSGRYHRWPDAPAEYAAIHFHDDDMGDIGWAPSLTLTIPSNWPSGLYALHLQNEAGQDNIPFVVRSAQAGTQAPIAVLLPTFTYQIYGQYPRGFAGAARDRSAAWGALVETPDEHPDYGLCAYNTHSDGSGVSIASMRRPMMDKRINQIHRVDPRGSGTYWLACDTYLLDWLDRRGIPCEVITDHDVHRAGAALLNRYGVVLTGQHPEYHTNETLAAIATYITAGGRFLYLGGNGFYWKIVPCEGDPWAVEVRRAEGGIRTWAADPGEGHHAFDGTLGGLWRRLGKPPQALVGVGFSSQGDYHAEPYRFTDAVTDTRVAFMTKGLDAAPDQVFGDAGLMGGGAAGHEIDRADTSLGTPAHALVVARAVPEDPRFQPVNEERLTHEWPGTRADLIRSDITFFETAAGGAVFSVGSMSFIGALPINGYDNTTVRMLDNVLRRFADPAPFPWPGAKG